MYNLRITGDIGFEIWQDIKGFEGYYKVSNYGRVLNVRSGRIKEPYTNINYKRVDLWKDGKRYKFLVHKLVAEVFLPYPFTNTETRQIDVNHLDENPFNNRVENLNYCTHRDNVLYGTALSRRKMTMIERGIWK